MGTLNPSSELLGEVRSAVAAHQPELTISTDGAVIIMKGRFVVSGPLGPFDSFQVWIGIPPDFPWNEPVVAEVNKRIPKTEERHVNSDLGNCCIGVWEEWLLTENDQSVASFLTGIVHDYFLSQTHFELKGEWPYGERPHGIAGAIESYCHLLELKSDEDLLVAHLRLLTQQSIKGHSTCPCGSGLRVRDCCRDRLELLTKQVPVRFAMRMLDRVAPKRTAVPGSKKKRKARSN